MCGPVIKEKTEYAKYFGCNEFKQVPGGWTNF